MKKLVKLFLSLVTVVVIVYGSYAFRSTDVISSLALANVEALAFDEGPIDPNTAYGYKLINCYDKNKKITGAICDQVQDTKSECKYTSCWGKCN